MKNPDWYQAASPGGCDCVTAIKSALTAEEFRGFCIGNVYKYMWRAQKKGKYADDLAKAADYLQVLREVSNET